MKWSNWFGWHGADHYETVQRPRYMRLFWTLVVVAGLCWTVALVGAVGAAITEPSSRTVHVECP